MNIGADGERLSALREQKKAQYAADLLKQIEENNRRKYQKSSQNDRQVNVMGNGPFRGAVVQPSINKANGSNRTNNNNYPYHNNTQGKNANYAPTSLAPINIQFGGSALSKISTSNPSRLTNNMNTNFDKQSFERRIQDLINQIMSQRQQANDLSEDVNSLQGYIPKFQNEIQQVQAGINKTQSSDIPYFVRTYGEELKNKKNDLDKSVSETVNKLNGLKEKVLTSKNEFKNFEAKFNEFAETSKSQLTGLKSENARQGNIFAKTAQKIVNGEQRNDSIAMKIRDQGNEFENASSAISNAFQTAQQNISNTMKEVSQHLANEIQNESSSRVQLTIQHSDQIKTLNNNVQTSINQITANSKGLASSFNESMSSLQTAISASIDEIQNEADEYNADITNKLESLIGDTESNFNAIQNEFVETIQAIKQSVGDTFNVLEETLVQEADKRKRNTEKILSKYDQFKQVVERELKIQMENVSDVFGDIESIEKGNADEILKPAVCETSHLKNLIDSLDEQEAAISRLELSIQASCEQTLGAVKQLNGNIKKIESDFEETCKEIKNKYDDLDQKLSKFESTRNSTELPPIDYIYNLSKEMDNKTETAIAEAEKQLDVALRALAALMGGRKPAPSDMVDILDYKGQSEESSSFSYFKFNNKNAPESESPRTLPPTPKEESEPLPDSEPDSEIHDLIPETESVIESKLNVEEEEKQEEEEEVEDEGEKKQEMVEPINIPVGNVEIGNISDLDSPGSGIKDNSLTFNPDDFAFKLPLSKTKPLPPTDFPPVKIETQNDNQEEEEEEGDDNDNADININNKNAKEEQPYNNFLKGARPVC